MNNSYLLDCTLRDGGYINNWRFGNSTIRSIIMRLDNAGVDIIECGFLDSRVEYDKNCSIFPNIPSVEKIMGNIQPKKSMLVAMVDFGTFEDDLLIPKSQSVLDGIRLIFKKEDMNPALKQAEKIKQLGYKLFINPVAITSYRNNELISLITEINEVCPFGMSIVDTYGMMFDVDIQKLIYIINDELHHDIVLGYHCHNNIDMANAHCINYIDKVLYRDKVIDTSILGMGKNSGNACTEIIASYFNKQKLKSYNIDHIIDAAYTDVMKFQNHSNWGYRIDNFISAINECSPNWIKFLMSKNTLSIADINTILSALPIEKREVSFFNKELAETKYLEHINRYIEDGTATETLKSEISNRPVLLLCPGKTLTTHADVIEKYIADNNPCVITVNFITDKFQSDFAFISNPYRYSQILGLCSDLENKPPFIITSNIVANDILKPTHTLNYMKLYEKNMSDNSAGLIISFLENIEIKSISIAGMDGFDKTSTNNNFFDNDLLIGDIGIGANETLIEQLSKLISNKTINFKWITPSIIEDRCAK